MNNGNTKRRRKFRASTSLYVPPTGSKKGADEEECGIAITSAQISDNRKFILHLKNWGIAKKGESKTVTGKGIAHLVEKIAHGGRVSNEDENLILETIAAQRGWWSVLVVMDTLIVTLTTAMLCFEDLTNNGNWSKASGERILFAYHTLLAFLLYFTICHMTILLLVSGLSTYIFEVKGILTFYVQCHSLLVHVNFSGIAFMCPCCLCVAVLAQVYSYGFWHAFPAIALCLCTFGLIAGFYGRVIRPLFTGLYNEEYGIDFEDTDLEAD